MSQNLECPIVVDLGSFQSRYGFASEISPRDVFRSKLWREMNSKNIYSIGNLVSRNSYPLKFPFERRNYCTDSKTIEIVFEYIYKNLNISFENHPIFLSESYLNSIENSKLITEILFENLNVPCLNFGLQSVLSLLSNGIMTGAALDSGDGLTETACLKDGQVVKNSINILNVGGGDLTNYLMDMINLKLNQFHGSNEKEIIRNIKENVCYLSEDYIDEVKKFESLELSLGNFYELPDGRTISPGVERINCPEIMFQPNIAGFDGPGVDEILKKSIDSTDKTIEDTCYLNVFLSGGNTRFRGFGNRLENELRKLSCKKVRVKKPVIPNSEHSAWIGASIIASLTSFQNMWITKDEYKEYGYRILEIKNPFF